MARRPANGPSLSSSVVGRSSLKRVKSPPPVRVEALSSQQGNQRVHYHAEETARLEKAAADREAQQVVDERDRRELAARGLRRPGNGRPPSTPRRLSEREIEVGRSAAGGWTRATLAAWGVPWPPPKGWKDALMAGRPVTRRAAPRSESGAR